MATTLKKVGFSMAVLLIFLFVLEGAVRLKWFFTTSETYYLFYGLPASLARPIYLAAKGSRLIPQKKKPNEFRFAAFGGSTTARWGDLQKQNWPGWLEKLLQDAFPNKKIIAENWGTSGATSDYVATSVRHRLGFRKKHKGLPDLVIIYSGINDAVNVGGFWHEFDWLDRLYHWIGSRSLFFVSMRYKAIQLFKRVTTTKSARDWNEFKGFSHRPPEEPRRRRAFSAVRPSDAKILLTLGLASGRYRTYISDAITFTKGMNVPVIVGTIPINTRRTPQKLILAHETIFRVLKEVANDHRVPLVDVWREFQKTPTQDTSFSRYDSVHLNQRGMKQVAEIFFKTILDMGLVTITSQAD